MAWPTAISAGLSTGFKDVINAVIAGLATWAGPVNANNNTLSNVGALQCASLNVAGTPLSTTAYQSWAADIVGNSHNLSGVADGSFATLHIAGVLYTVPVVALYGERVLTSSGGGVYNITATLVAGISVYVDGLKQPKTIWTLNTASSPKTITFSAGNIPASDETVEIAGLLS